MAQPILNLPTNIPWKQIAVSSDMMDTEFCNKKFPFAWRSSMAISAYEPKPDELPQELCGDRITYLKITASITGYQPTAKETLEIAKTEDTLITSFPSIPTEDLRKELYRITNEYFACYGVLLNVAVFPYPRKSKVFSEQLRIKLAELEHTEPGSVLDNPFVHTSGITFEATGEENNRVVDRFPEGGDGQGELDLHKKLVITLPSPEEVEAVEVKIVHQSESEVNMEAFKGSESLGTQSAGNEKGQVHKLYMEGKGIDRVVLTAPDDKASLLEFAAFVGPGEKKDIPLKDYPHIIDMEPKTRDLYQAATESGEVLTGSKSGIKVDKSFTHTESTESSLKLGADITIPFGEDIKKSGGINANIDTTRTNKESDKDHWATQTDASRERRETQSSATELSQMYNLLTSYHAGTNRSAHLMLPRPHVLQPTDRRTFVQGLRAIEGMQEFFLVVARPENIKGLCIEASLETGHYPEDASIIEPPEKYKEDDDEFVVKAKSGDRAIEDSVTSIHNIESGWVIDRSKGDPFHSGIEFLGGEVSSRFEDNVEITLDNVEEIIDGFEYQLIDDFNVRVTGRVNRFFILFFSSQRTVELKFRVFIHSEEPKPTHEQPRADIGQMLITTRDLCTRFRSDEGCLEVLPVWQLPGNIGDWRDWIVDEPHIRVNAELLTREASRESRLPAIKQFQQQIQSAMTSSWRQPNRRAVGEVGFLDSDYFKDQIRKLIPEDHLKTPVGKVSGLPESIIKTFGERSTISEILDLDIASLAKRTGLSIEEASKARHRLLGIAPEPGKNTKQQDNGDEKNTE